MVLAACVGHYLTRHHGRMRLLKLPIRANPVPFWWLLHHAPSFSRLPRCFETWTARGWLLQQVSHGPIKVAV